MVYSVSANIIQFYIDISAQISCSGVHTASRFHVHKAKYKAVHIHLQPDTHPCSLLAQLDQRMQECMKGTKNNEYNKASSVLTAPVIKQVLISFHALHITSS